MDTDVGSVHAVDDAEAAFFARGGRCCCFPWPPSSSQHRASAPGSLEDEGLWQRVADAVLKVREWSELVAGPKWKTFIRRFGRGPRPHNFGRRLNYDPLSYALNFDEGHGASPEGGYTGYRDFSARFAAPPPSAKSSMDLGGRDAPPLFNPPPAEGAARA